MRILVLGAGAIGGFYGAQLLKAGAQVTFLVRPARQARLQAQGLRVTADAEVLHEGPVRTLTEAGQGGEYDAILLTCKGYDLDTAMEAIAPAVGPGTHILPMLNGLSAYDRLDARFGRERILGGVAYVATMLRPDGSITQFGRLDRVIIGPRTSTAEPSARKLHAVFAATAGVREYDADVEQALWDKWVGIAAAAAMCCLMRGNVGEIVRTADGASLMRQAIEECLQVAAAAGRPMAQAGRDALFARLLDPASSWAASMMRDIAQGADRLEADDIVGDLVLRGQQLGIAMPMMRSAYCHLQVYGLQRATR